MTATSQNGFPALAADSHLLHKWVIPGTDRTLVLRNGSAGFLLVHLTMFFDDRVEDIDGGVWDDWGYAYRPIRGYETTLSNHSSGTAIDLNATKHVLGKEDTFSPEEEMMIRRRVNNFFDDVIRWGGEYQGRKDEMHFEIDAGIKVCEIVAKRLLTTPRGKRILEANPGQKAVILS